MYERRLADLKHRLYGGKLRLCHAGTWKGVGGGLNVAYDYGESEVLMATILPDMHAAAPPVSPEQLERLEQMATRRGWTLDSAMRHALDIADVILDAEDDPKSKVFVYKGDRRYSLHIKA